MSVGIVDLPTVTVGDKTGGLKMSVIGRKPAGGEWSGRWSVVRATGELDGLRGCGPGGALDGIPQRPRCGVRFRMPGLVIRT